ncbi:MAG: hypothetical protein GQ529_06320 [Methyloprofundus sp.]|nr:hypothetical protein [Methyloprofundus sp.]
MSLLRLIFSLLFSLSIVSNALALNLPNLHEVKLPIPATLADKALGTEIAISGSTVAITAYAENKNIAGSVYLYAAQENWRLSAEVTSEFTADGFARHVILHDNLLLVSADTDDSHGTNSGAVYVFERTLVDNPHHWQQTAKLIAPDVQAGDRFGAGIALVDDVLYIGAPSRGQGKVYIFTRDLQSKHWQVIDSIEPIDPQAARFGTAIDQDGDTLIIGAPYTNADNSEEAEARIRQPRFAISKGDTFDPGIESGAIYVYKKHAGLWQFSERLGSSNRETTDHLGSKIAIEGDIIAASIKHKDVFDDLRAGAVYIYKKRDNQWLEDSALVASNPNVGANFGVSFSLVNRQILVGANKIHADGFNSGQAYLFAPGSNNSWELIHQYANAALKAHDQFGLGVALGSDYLLTASRQGVYVFQDAPIHDYPATYYLDSRTLQLNEVSLVGVGVLSATLHLNQVADTLLLTVMDYHLRTDLESSDIQYSANTRRLTIPKLAVQTKTGELEFYTVVLQQIDNPDSIQFRVLSLTPIES